MRITNRQRKTRLEAGACRTLTEKVLRILGRPESEVGLTFVGDRRIRTLNRLYRKKDRPTDVLAFPLAHARPLRGAGRTLPPVLLGDVVISVPTAVRQAREHNHGLRREIAWLLIHGILHLLGYDHLRPAEARRMRRKEKALLKTSYHD
ncbi:MAG TPA: rRNA maturation RNase YbeY [Nitrospiria bacterium]